MLHTAIPEFESRRLAERLRAIKDRAAQPLAGSDTAHRHPSAAAQDGPQPMHGIAVEIGDYADPMFKPKGWALD